MAEVAAAQDKVGGCCEYYYLSYGANCALRDAKGKGVLAVVCGENGELCFLAQSVHVRVWFFVWDLHLANTA